MGGRGDAGTVPDVVVSGGGGVKLLLGVPLILAIEVNPADKLDGDAAMSLLRCSFRLCFRFKMGS